jgi:hypothetical protein
MNARTQYNAAALGLLQHIDELTAAVKRHAAREMRGSGGHGWVDDVLHVDAEVCELIAYLSGKPKTLVQEIESHGRS